jgi:hypothetical protein
MSNDDGVGIVCVPWSEMRPHIPILYSGEIKISGSIVNVMTKTVQPSVKQPLR